MIALEVRFAHSSIVNCLLSTASLSSVFTLNGELLYDMDDSSVAFNHIDTSKGFMPAITLAGGEQAQINFGMTGDLKYYNLVQAMGYTALCAPQALQYNIPLWFTSHGGLKMLGKDSVEKYEAVHKSSSIQVVCKDWDYSLQSDQECFRLNAGCSVASNTVTPPPPTLLPRPTLLTPTPSPLAENVGELSLEGAQSVRHTKPVSFSVVFPSGQAPSTAFVGWTTPTFRYVDGQFDMADQDDDALMEDQTQEGRDYGQHAEVVIGGTPGDVTSMSSAEKKCFRSAFMVCLSSLLPTYTPQLISPVR